jgi:hypothetical protein
MMLQICVETVDYDKVVCLLAGQIRNYHVRSRQQLSGCTRDEDVA